MTCSNPSSGCIAPSSSENARPIATPEEARRANTVQRLQMRTQDNYLPEIEELAERMVAETGHVSGALHPPRGGTDGDEASASTSST